MKHCISRRRFIERHLTAAVAVSAFPTIIPASALGKEGAVAPSKRTVVAAIGTGPQGRGVMGGFLSQSGVQVVAVCDLSKRNLEAARKQVNEHYHNSDCATVHDFREVLARKDIDAVSIATPDHWHVPVALAAARAKKDMYLEKPMGLSVQEDQMLRAACQKHQVIFQFGTQQRSSREFRRACELVRNGRIGKLKQINVWSSASHPGGPTKTVPAPADLDYNFWLGPAPDKPYTDGKAFDNDPPGSWKTWWFNYDYALGFIAGWGVHPLDIAYWGHPGMMKGPAEVQGRAVIPTEGACNTSVAWLVDFTFADGVRMRYKGTPNNFNEASELTDFREWRERYRGIADHGTAFEGAEGWVMVNRGTLRTSPENLATDPPAAGEVRLLESPYHQKNFVDSLRARRPAICPIEDAVQADILCHVSDIATRVNRKLTWDPAKEKFVNAADANARLKLRPMRAPWKLS